LNGGARTGNSGLGEVDAEHLGGRPALRQHLRSGTGSAAHIEHALRLQPDEVQALDHAVLDFTQQEIGRVGMLGTALELAAYRRTV
jgi:hypothetical protein